MKKILALTLTLIMIFSFSIIASAEQSPTASTTSVGIKEIVNNTDVGSVTSKIDYDSKTITFSVKPIEGYSFVEWAIVGDYEIVSGDLKSGTVTISFKGSADEVFAFVLLENDETGEQWALSSAEGTPAELVDEEFTTPAKTDKTDKTDKPTSPITGDTSTSATTMPIVLFTAAMALVVVLFSRKKLAK